MYVVLTFTTTVCADNYRVSRQFEIIYFFSSLFIVAVLPATGGTMDVPAVATDDDRCRR